jgi:hypothetical protein
MEKQKTMKSVQEPAPSPRRSPDTASGSQKTVPAKAKESIRNPLLALIFSFLFPGWGQWYDGERWKGLVFFGIAIILGVLNIALIIILKGNLPVSAVFTILGAGIWIYGMYDAFTTAESINRGEAGFTRKSRLFWLPAIILGLMIAFLIMAFAFAFIFGMAGNIHPASGNAPFSGSDIQRVKVVAVTALQPDAGHIVVTYQGGQDASQVSWVTVKVTDSDGRYQTKSMGDPGIKSPAPGDTLTFVGTPGKDHVAAAAIFTDGSSQTILDVYI